MAKTPVSAETLALDALRQLVADPTPRVLLGTAGIFAKKSAASQEAASICQRNSWLETTQDTVKKGRSVEHLWRITANGFHAVLSRSDSLAVLKSLQSSVSELEAILKAVPARVSALHAAVESLAQKSQPLDLATVTKQMSAVDRTSSSNGEMTKSVHDIIHLRKNSGEPGSCPLPELYTALREAYPSVTVGAFHDLLRKLDKEKKIRLTHWGLPLVEMPESDLALLISHKVMYYVDLA